MNKPTVKFPTYNHSLRFSLDHDITLHEFMDVCLKLNGRPLNRSEVGITIPSSKYTSELVHRDDVQMMMKDNPYIRRFFKDKYMNGLRSIRFSISPYSNCVYWDMKYWKEQCDEEPDKILIEKGRGELLFLIDHIQTFEPEGFSDNEHEKIKSVLEKHGFKFDERN